MHLFKYLNIQVCKCSSMQIWYTSESVKNSYARISILRKLKAFQVPTDDLINIYVLYIRSRLEQSAVVWHSSLTLGEE